ncbi:aryl hydrocarbon receptor isoform X1 [Etheostoma spectabile]|uniref:aryl hydrocarbon receptor isoform X1 n=1 Tax=Etheostoma spectabile TaxID=54343 RepID=UPI0013AF0C8C|nr:aryl hydrocarbon receptor-like isoform X1 [Etheostoma spectabile]
MLGNGRVYAVKRRKKPVQRSGKPPPAKTNPSKRHRDRLNGELECLSSMLPFSDELRSHLDKLSVLRLSVGYLKVKSYFHATLQKHARSAPLASANGRTGPSVSLDGVSFSEGELLLQALNGFVLVVTSDGTIFYASPTIQDFLGFHQSDVVQQSVHELVHVDDREEFRCQLHFALNPSNTLSDSRAQDGQSSRKATSSSTGMLPQYIPPENSSFMERSFCCRLRCLLDNTSGFLALNFNGRLKYLHLQGNPGADGTAAPPQLALFAIATPLQPPSVMEIRSKTLIFQTKHNMDFAPVGIDARGKLVLGYSETELVTTGSGYQFIHAADMMYCADNHLKMMKTGDSGFTFFRLLIKTGHWLWVQANARVVFKDGRPDFIIARQKALTNEEGEEHLHQRRKQLPFNLTTGEGVLYDVSLESIPGPPGSGAPGTTGPATEKPLDPASLLGSLLRQDHSVYTQPPKPSPPLPIFTQIEDPDFEQPQSSLEQAFLDSHALLSVPGQIQASQKRSVKGDRTTEAMIDSLEQILGDIGDGGIEGLEVEERELRDWEKTLARMNEEREDVSRKLNQMLANDVFSYVEEALRKETGGYVQDSDFLGSVSGSINSLSIQGQHPGSRFSKNECQQGTDMTSGFAEHTQLGDGPCGVGCSTGLKGPSHGVPHTQCLNAHQGHASSLWPPSSNHHSGNQMISTQSCHAAVTQHSWLPSVQHTNNFHNNCHQSGLNHSVQYTGSHPTCIGPQLQSPSVWQQQQQPQSFHNRTLTHSSTTPGDVNSTAQSFHPEMQSLYGSCMYEKREATATATVPTGQTGPLLGPSCSGGSTNAAFYMPHLGIAVGVFNQGMMQSSAAGCTDVGNISLVHPGGDNSGLGTAPSEYPPVNGS